MISLTCGIKKKKVQMKLFTKQTHKQKTNLWLPKGKGGGRDKLGDWG